MRIIVCLFILIGLLGCTKPNPNPELADEIYQDLQSSAQNAQKESESEKKKLEEYKKELDSVVPQTGAIKYAQKRYFESEIKLQKLEQAAKYYELKAESRKQYTKIEYMKAFKAGKPWPTEEELASYKQYKDSSKVAGGWNTKKRVTDYEASRGIAPAAKAQEGAEKKAEAPKKEE